LPGALNFCDHTQNFAHQALQIEGKAGNEAILWGKTNPSQWLTGNLQEYTKKLTSKIPFFFSHREIFSKNMLGSCEIYL
jgi:hypothetical protein